MQMNETRSFFSGKDRGPRDLNFSNRYFLRGALDSTFNRQRESDTFITIAIYIPSAFEFNAKWLQTDNPEFLSGHNIRKSTKAVWRELYKYPSVFYNYREGETSLSINPVFNFQSGPAGQWGRTFIQNTRGAEIRGTLGAKIGFYSRVLENQWFAQDYMRHWGDSLGVVPGMGWWRPFDSTGFDFFSVKGYVNANLIENHLNAAFGHDKMFIGNGYRSLVLSDFAKEFLFLRLNTQIGPLHYQNIFGQLNNRIPSPGMLPGNTLLPKKYMAVHRASVLIKKRLELGLTEMVVFDRDSLGDGGFEAEYLNPVIFYRAVESNLGSRDNALIALDAKLYVLGKYIVYGQFLIDEFRIREVKAGNGWWANKFGWQLGAKTTFNFNNSVLFVQAESNTVKPYTYSHYRVSQNWTQYGQPLAHPLGANFTEILGRIIFQPARMPKLRFSILSMWAKKGNDSAFYNGKNYGGNLSRSSDSRQSDYNNKLFQGNISTIHNTRFDLTYMFKHNLFFDFGFQIRSQSGFNSQSGNWLNLGIRLNVEAIQGVL